MEYVGEVVWEIEAENREDEYLKTIQVPAGPRPINTANRCSLSKDSFSDSVFRTAVHSAIIRFPRRTRPFQRGPVLRRRHQPSEFFPVPKRLELHRESAEKWKELSGIDKPASNDRNTSLQRAGGAG